MIKTPIKSSPRLPLKLHKDLQEGDKKKDKKNVKTKKKKKLSRSKSKNSFHQQIIHSVHKKLEKNKKLKKKMNTKEKLCFNKMQIIESKEFKELCMLESEYRKSIK